ncbi:MAG: protein translocase subunit SecF [Alteromonadaceae bacterium]|nr:MAG: protein translocase subunit SecF [Alteromonadaceae bacterium]
MSKQIKIINFMGQRKVAATISIVLLVLSIASLAVNHLNFGLDFTGGTEVELEYQNSANLEQIRKDLKAEGYRSAVVTNFGSDKNVLIRVQVSDAKDGEEAKLGEQIKAFLTSKATGDVRLKRISFVGPQIGDELRDDGGLGMLVALAMVMAYIAIRFQWKFSIGAVAALIHDVIIVLGLFSVTGIDFDLTVLAAVLAVIGYSLNDTIVVSDRIRENFRILRDKAPLEVINISLSQTLGRTIITSFTTLLVLLALFFVGGEVIHSFAIALITGVVVGTYSSIYVAANVLLVMGVSKEDLIQLEVEKEGADQDEITF